LVIDENLYRPSEVNILQGDASKAKKKLAWFPEVSFKELVREMVEGDLEWYSSTQGKPFDQH
jgi:GDPmannose 4,6-dehydratase